MEVVRTNSQIMESLIDKLRKERKFIFGDVGKAARDLLVGLGEDPDREGLVRTPERIAMFFSEFLNPPDFEFTSFDNDGSSEMIVQSDIEFHSLCEHHLLPFYGTAVVAYIPNKRIVGISKLARCVDFKSRGLQNQERITKQVADTLMEALTVKLPNASPLQPLGVAVVLRARHLCMEMRGIKKRGAYTTTSCLYGAFRDKPETRAEFLSLANNLKA